MKKKLLTILLSAFMLMTTFTTRVFAAETNFTTIAEVLATASNFATDSSSPTCWKKDTDKTYIYQGNKLVFGSYSNIMLNTSVNKQDNKTYIANITDTSYGNSTITFNLNDDGVLISIYLNKEGNYTWLTGTYTAPITIASLLDTVEGGFPTTKGDAWVSSIGDIMYQANNKLNMTLEPKEISDGTLVHKAGNNYETDVINNDYKFVFVMNNSGELQQIDLVIVDGNVTHTYKPLGDRKDLAYVLGTLPYDFPSTNTTGWPNSNNSDIKIFKNSNDPNFLDLEMLSFYVPGYDNVPFFPTTIPLKTYGSNYQLDMLDQFNIVINFIMRSNNILERIEVVNAPDDGMALILGTYFAPVTVASILPTDFPITEETGWFNENGKKIYNNGSNLNASFNVPLESVLQKDGNNYKYSNDGDQSFTFVMTSEVLTSIIVSGAILTNFNGEYVPYKYTNNPISIPVGYTGDIEFVTNASYTNDGDVIVKVNGELLVDTYYTLAHGSTHVTLKGSYVSTLPIGTHTITIGVDGYGFVDQDFMITAAPSPSPNKSKGYTAPKTGIE